MSGTVFGETGKDQDPTTNLQERQQQPLTGCFRRLRVQSHLPSSRDLWYRLQPRGAVQNASDV